MTSIHYLHLSNAWFKLSNNRLANHAQTGSSSISAYAIHHWHASTCTPTTPCTLRRCSLSLLSPLGTWPQDVVRISQAARALVRQSGIGGMSGSITSHEALALRAAAMFGRSVEVQTGDLQWTRGELLGEGAYGKVGGGGGDGGTGARAGGAEHWLGVMCSGWCGNRIGIAGSATMIWLLSCGG